MLAAFQGIRYKPKFINENSNKEKQKPKSTAEQEKALRKAGLIIKEV